MSPASDRLARTLMIVLGIASVGAFANAALAFESWAPDRINIETWRMFGFLVFAGLFTLLGLFPRRLTGVWELVFFHKAGVATFLAFFVKAGPVVEARLSETATSIIAVDAALAVTTLFCYLLTQGWRAWGRDVS